ncbi:MAG: cytochrome c oxidase subunit 3 [Bacteroidota bacterium]|nr:cytochrome c oxidase subunit 3 [Bacteroidota bacterium]
MDLTQGTIKEKKGRAKKMMLWFGIASLIMSFGGLTSAFIVSSTREDWLFNFQLPESFTYSTLIIFFSSILLFISKKALKKEQYFLSLAALIGTFILGLAFIFTQFSGFNELIASGYNFTGPTSNITMSYIYVIAVVHILHVVVGLITLSVTIINHSQNRYSPSKIQGFELAATFWHFIDILWLYLFFFLYFFNKIN